MISHNLGYPRIGVYRELKKACEKYWAGKISEEELIQVGREIRNSNWLLQKNAGVDLIPSNDFSFYDHVLDMSFLLGTIPERYNQLLGKDSAQHGQMNLDIYFAMARGYQKKGFDITAMEMTKWFDTNYHFIVPEFVKEQSFRISSSKPFDEFNEAKSLGINSKPVLIGPVSYLLLGKGKEKGFNKLDLLDSILPVYAEILKKLEALGAEWIQLDEPYLIMDLTEQQKKSFGRAYDELNKHLSKTKILVTTFFEGLRDNKDIAVNLPVNAIHIDLVRAPGQLDEVLNSLPPDMALSLGVIDGRNVWKNDLDDSLILIKKAVNKIGPERILLAPSCSLLHSPCDLDYEKNETALPENIKRWMSFAKQKIDEIVLLKKLSGGKPDEFAQNQLILNNKDIFAKKNSELIHNVIVKEKVKSLNNTAYKRQSSFKERRQKQRQALKLPKFPTTTIGSFPQTNEVRSWRAKLKKGELTNEQYENNIKSEIERVIRWQESIGIDVLVHGEFERNDMVEYFGELLDGFVFTKNGWVQSYGSRCVKPPVIFGDVRRTKEMTVRWSKYAQSLTSKVVKGMLTGPATILQWSFVRNDQTRSETAFQLALAIRDEVLDLEKAGIRIIQIDEPALREGLPLRRSDWKQYLDWAVKCFRIVSSGVKDETQIHTHMCYSEFNDIIESIAELDADVISIETSRSQMELLDTFVDFKYPNEIGPGVYDIHSPRIPSKQEISSLLKKAASVINSDQIWVNPDCGLKTRGWAETEPSLKAMVEAAKEMRNNN